WDERRLLRRAALKDTPPGVEAGLRQTVLGTEGPHAEAAHPPLTDPAPPLPRLPLVPRSAWGHECALPSEGLHHGRQEREPPDAHGRQASLLPRPGREVGRG